MSEIQETHQVVETEEIQKYIKLLGLQLSDLELHQLQLGNIISLESRRLSEIGSVFILAEALSTASLVKKNITFNDLPQTVRDFPCSSGVPIYYWNSDLQGKCGLLLTLVDGKPGIRISTQN
ncbi:hypothetical protein [Nostoc sp. C117]|uniref:hypothetical protein n=1 Tax=Nostoc sp. C117 TaxID=3349875 RepID=UPI00370D9B8D